ncbi:33983_t:CDS:2 [Gigaspora margarita]|uniref:33983_t:CDS:1 n=1 Tax=Gigaspora margarita TaxID=4874 RepID=A0ABN7VA66_GIGMA|nr:33983_t:CDS:2 [Gigaspora margarita]
MCFVLGSPLSGCFPIDICKKLTFDGAEVNIEDLSVGHLKKLILNTIKEDIALNYLELWKVEISLTDEEKKYEVLIERPYNVDIEQEFGGIKLDGFMMFSDVFQNDYNPPKRHIHLIVRLPTTTSNNTPNSLEWSIRSVDNNSILLGVNQIIAPFDQLFTKCSDEKLELHIFQPDRNHPSFNMIQKLQIPSNPEYNNSSPFFLINDLPKDGHGGITDTTDLEQFSQTKECLVVMGTSGSGKTRTLIEFLCKKYGFYFIGTTMGNPGSNDLHNMVQYMSSKLTRTSSTDNDAYALRFCKCMLLARIYLLNYIFEKYKKISAYNWTFLQLFPTYFFEDVDIFDELTFEFRKTSEDFLDDSIQSLILKIRKFTNQIRLPIILDEAQVIIDQFEDKFTSSTNSEVTRPLYSIVIRAFTMRHVCVIPSGTGLTMKSVINLTGSGVVKGRNWNNQMVIIKNGFDSIDKVRNFLSKFGFPCDDHQNILQWLVGRVRFTASFAEEWLSTDCSISELFDWFKRKYTDPNSDKSIMIKIIKRTDNESVRKRIRESLLEEGASDFDIISLLERIVAKIWYTGCSSILAQESALTLFEYGIALLERSSFGDLQICVYEPLVIYSALEYFQKYKDLSFHILDIMSEVSYSPSSMGILWESLIPDAITKLFQNNAHVFKRPLPYKDWEIYQPPNSKPCVLAMRNSSNYNLPDFLENPIAPFFYPENTAGPDVVTVVCPVNSDKKYLVLTQAKLREKNEGDVLLTTDPRKFYHTRSKNTEDKLLKGKIYEESYNKVSKLIDEKYDGVFRVFISYPATVKLKEEIDRSTNIEMDSTSENWTAIIDANNCNLIFDQRHLNMINGLKQSKKRK